MSVWLTMLAAGAITYATRLSFIMLSDRWEMPDWFRRALRFVPVSVLTAIFLPEMVLQAGSVDISLGNTRLLAGLLAILIAWRTRNVLITIVVGMAALWILQALLP